MKGDEEFEAMVRAALAGGEPMRAERLAALEEAAAGAWAARRRSGAWRPLLVAASLAVICGIGTWRLAIDRRQVRECRAVAMLELLEELDGTGVSGAGDSFADRLVAWQDAPYEEVMR